MKYLIVLGRLFHCVLNALQKNFFIETEIKLICNGGGFTLTEEGTAFGFNLCSQS